MSIPADVNALQWQAITHRGSHLLIIAGPGTGKTHTLVHRICNVACDLTDSQRILAITFTNKAAREMRERLRSHPNYPRRVTVGTFHSFALQLLRQYAAQTMLPPDFRVASLDEIEELIQKVWDMKGRERRELLDSIAHWKSGADTENIPPELNQYNHLLRHHHLLDFDDILIEAVTLLKTHSKINGEITNTYPYIFVDEYQDLNPVQYEFLRRILGLELNMGAGPVPSRYMASPAFLTAIGDPNQAIYGFRGSDVRFFESFVQDFPGAQTLRLQDNYRSAAFLLKASAQVIEKGNCFALPELIAKIYTEGRLTIHEAPTDKAEAEYIVHQIETLLGGTSLFSMDSGRVAGYQDAEAGFADFAVLYRLNSQRVLLEEALARSGIPYQVAGDKPLSSQPPVPEILALLRSAHGERIEDAAPARLILPEISYELGEGNIAHALHLLQKQPFGQQLIMSYPKGEEIFERLVRIAQGFDNFQQFWDDLLLNRAEDACEKGVQRVSLMTLHAAKGLEFPIVFIAGCEESLIPLQIGSLKSDLVEERRLFYVGMTRAQKRLYLIRAKERTLYGQRYATRPCPFWADIEEQLKVYEAILPHHPKKNRNNEKQFDLFQ